MYVSGTLTDVTSVALSDEDATYGVKRTDTGGILVAAGTAMTRASTGVYRYSLSEPAQGLVYRWNAAVTYLGVTNYLPFTTAGTPLTTTTGRYTTAARLRRRFGTANVRDWSDTESNAAEDSTAEADAIAYAEDEIDGFFAGSPYTVPFVATGSSLPANLIEWATVLAGYWLYTKRGFFDKDSTSNKLQRLHDAAMESMARYRSAYPIQLQGVSLRSDVSIAPAVVNPRTNYLSDGPVLYPSYQSRYFGERLVQGCGVVVQN